MAWDVDRLVELTAGFAPVEAPLSAIRELDEPFWYAAQGDEATCRSVALHAKLIGETDLSFPIILSQDGGVMDGMHRVCKALNAGLESILAVQFETDPEPHYVGVAPDELPYVDGLSYEAGLARRQMGD